MSSISPQFWKEIVIYQITSASISFAASTLIVSFIALNGLSTPYRRIIFGLSVSDMCQSFGILAGPFLTPSTTPQALWSIGNKHTCRVDGFLNLLGMTSVPIYSVFLCVYYVCKLKNRMTDARFTKRIESKVHVVIIAINLGLYLPALGMNIMNPNYLGNFCGPASVPTGCRQNPELYGECNKSSDKTLQFYSIISAAAVPIISIVGIFVCMGLIFWHELWRERMFGKRRDTDALTNNAGNRVTAATSHLSTSSTYTQNHSRRNQLRQSIATSRASAGEGESTDLDTGTDADILSNLYKKELISQAFCYGIVFCLTYLPLMLVVVFDKNSPSRLSNCALRVNFILYPLAGFFNIIVYTRWNVRSWKRSHPECSWLRAFWLVLKAGGDLPKEEDYEAEGDFLFNEDEGRPRLRNRPSSMSSRQFDLQARSVEAMDEYHASFLERGDLVSIPNVRVGNDLVKPATSEQASSVGTIDENVLPTTLKEGDAGYRPESQWFYIKGGSRLSIVKSSRFDTNASAATIQHANRGGDDHSDLASFADDISLTGLKQVESEKISTISHCEG